MAGSARGCLGLGPLLPRQHPADKWQLETRQGGGGESNKADPSTKTRQLNRNGSGWGAPKGAAPPSNCYQPPLSRRLSSATLQAPALLNLPAQGAKGTTGKSY